MQPCNHTAPDGHQPLVELRVLGDEPGKVLFGLVCTTCNFVIDRKWFPDQMRCLLERRALDPH